MSSLETFTWALLPTSDANGDPSRYVASAMQFGDAVAPAKSAALLIRKTDEGLRSYFVATINPSSEKNLVRNLGQAAMARLERAEFPDDISKTSAMAQLAFKRGSEMQSVSIYNVDPAESAKSLAETLEVGDWVLITMRRSLGQELNRHHAWATHQQMEWDSSMKNKPTSKGMLVASFYAGSSSYEGAREALEAARTAMPGFEYVAEVRPVDATIEGNRSMLSAIVPALAAGGLIYGHSSRFLHHVSPLVPAGLIALSVTLMVVGVLFKRGVVPSASTRLWSSLPTGVFPSPARRISLLRWSAPRREQTKVLANGGTQLIGAHDGDYPMAVTSFRLHPAVFVALASPTAGVHSGIIQTAYRSAPREFLELVGPPLGVCEDKMVYSPASEAFRGFRVIGRANSGKTGLLHGIFGWYMADRQRPFNVRGALGLRSVQVIFESKGGPKNVNDYMQWGVATNQRILLAELANRSASAIDMCAVPGSVSDQAVEWVGTLAAGFGTDSIQNRSRPALTAVFAGALSFDPRMVLLRWDDPTSGVDPRFDRLKLGETFIYYANVLVGNDDIQLGTELGLQMLEWHENKETRTSDSEEIATHLRNYWVRETASNRKGIFEAAANKISQLYQMNHWFTREHKVTWSQVLKNRGTNPDAAILINFGTGTDGSSVSEEMKNAFGAMLFYTLKRAIERECTDWQAEGRSVSIYSDELATVVTDNADTITWMDDQGRSFGVRTFFATQRLKQLRDRSSRVFDAFVNGGTLMSFAITSPDEARDTATELSGAGTAVTDVEVQGLGEFEGIVRIHDSSARRPAFTVKVPHFDGNPSGWVAQWRSAQGDVVSTDSHYGQAHSALVQQAPAPTQIGYGQPAPTPPALEIPVIVNPVAQPPESPGHDLGAW